MSEFFFEKERLFRQISLYFCHDGKITSEEFSILRKLAQKLKLDKNKANQIANEAIKLYKKGEIDKARKDSPDFIYQNLLLGFASDGILDAGEDDLLQGIKSTIGAKAENFKKMGAAGDKPVRLKPLVCKNCKGLFPLSHKEWIECPYCGEKNHIPRSYIDAIAARKLLTRHKSKIHEIRDSVGHVPTTFEYVISNFSDYLIFFLFFLVFIFTQHILNMVLFYPMALYYRHSLGLNFFDHASPALLAFTKMAVLYILLAIPFAWIYKLKRKVAVLGPLQMSLAAGPPKIPGGPATCNNCGGALEITATSHLVSCPYCETENLVNLPDKWLSTTKSRLADARQTFAQTLHNYKKETGRLKETLVCLFILFIVFGVILTGFYKLNLSNVFLPPATSDKASRDDLIPFKLLKAKKEFAKWNKLSLYYAKRNRDFVELFFLMKAGEKIAVQWKPDMEYYRGLQEKRYYMRDIPVPDRLKTEFFLTFDYTPSAQTEMKKIATRIMPPEKEFIFTANVAGYHHLRFHFPEHLNKFYTKITRQNDN